MDQIIVDVPWDVLMGNGGRSRKPTPIFVAYRFDDGRSRELREAISDAVKSERWLTDTDGHVDEGEPWAPTVRKRIKRSKFVVADLTGPSREVLFEVGFAGNKVVMALCYDEEALAAMPTCLTMRQIRTFADDGLPLVVERVIDRALGQVPTVKRPSPVPGQIVWLQGENSAWADEARHRVQGLCREHGLEMTRVDPEGMHSYEDLEQQMRAWMLVGCIDGGPSDLAAHLFFGDAVGRTGAGAGRGKGQYLNRHAIALCETKDASKRFLADSVRRVSSDHITIAVGDSALLQVVDKNLKRHDAWLRQST